jgi:hypothetical protein
MLANQQSEKTYKVAIRGREHGSNYCSCPDFSINNLGTCKHIEFTLLKLMKRKGEKKRSKMVFHSSTPRYTLTMGLKDSLDLSPAKTLPKNCTPMRENISVRTAY